LVPARYEFSEEKERSKEEIDAELKQTIQEWYYQEYKCYKNHEIAFENIKYLAKLEGYSDINWQELEKKLELEIQNDTKTQQ
jgi:hypothetical protein